MFQKVMLLCALLSCSFSVSAVTCEGPYRGKTINQQQLNAILSQARATPLQPLNLCGANMSGLDFSKQNLAEVDFYGSDLSRSNFNHANLSNANLEKAYFRWATMNHVNLTQANLKQAIISNAQLNNAKLNQAHLESAELTNVQLNNASLVGSFLQQANLNNAQLTNTNLTWAQLNRAQLEQANLSGALLENTQLLAANLRRADLSQAQFIRANLTSADLTATKLANTQFTESNLTAVRYQPQLGYIPNLISFSQVVGFRSLNFDAKHGIPALVELRTGFKNAGMRQLERATTAMIKNKEMQLNWQQGGWGRLEALFSAVLFKYTCDFGAAPGRALRLFVIFIFLFMLPYWVALRWPTRGNGIVVYWRPKRFALWNRDHCYTQDIYLQKLLRSNAEMRNHWRAIQRNLGILIYFSLLSAFQIGWRDLNVSNWLSRLTPREHDMKAKGWVRIVAGLQSLISVYLVVLWALTYFGRPFEW